MTMEKEYAEQLNSVSSNKFYMHLGKDKVEYTFSSMKRAKQVSSLVEIAENLGLRHSQNFRDTVSIRVNSSFHISQDLGGAIYLVGKYSELTYISFNTIKELISEGYSLEFDGLLILITRSNCETEREQIEYLKALGDKYPLGFSRFKSSV